MKMYKLGAAAVFLGVSTQTLRVWDDRGTFVPEERKGSRAMRMYSEKQLISKLPVAAKSKVYLGYCRVNDPARSEVLALQKEKIQKYVTAEEVEDCTIFEDVGTLEDGIGLHKLFETLKLGFTRYIILGSQDVFGVDNIGLMRTLFQVYGIEVIVCSGTCTTYTVEEDLQALQENIMRVKRYINTSDTKLGKYLMKMVTDLETKL